MATFDEQASFDEATTESHRIARLSFVPWLARFLGNGSTKQTSPYLAVGDPDALTDETVKAIQEIANLACWRFLVRECGWLKLEAVSVQNPENYSCRRMLQEGDALPSLTFTTATPDLLLTIFNVTGESQSVENIEMPDCLTSNGDLILHHLVFRRLFSEPQSFGIERDHQWLQWYCNPLNICLDPIGYRGDESMQVQWQRLFTEDLMPYLTWMSEHLFTHQIMPCWNESQVQIEQSLAWLEGVSSVSEQWIEAASKIDRPDLVCWLFRLMTRHCGQLEVLLNQFEELHKGQPIRVRQGRAAVWDRFIKLADQVESITNRCLEIHPVNRSGAQKCFLARWEAVGFESRVEELRELSQTLRPAFN